MTVTSKKIAERKMVFQIPTQVTNLEPIYTFNFHIDEKQGEPKVMSFELELNPKLIQQQRNNKKGAFFFDEKGICQFHQIDQNNYFIKGDIRLLQYEEHLSTEMNHDKNLFFSITYGNTKDQVHFIKGKFNLNQPNNN